MRTYAMMERPRQSSVPHLLAVLFLALPALFAYLCAVAFSYDSHYSGPERTLLTSGPWFLSSGFWFFYESSRILGYLGIFVAATITASAAIRRTVSEMMALWMASSILGAMALLWFAAKGHHGLP